MNRLVFLHRGGRDVLSEVVRQAGRHCWKFAHKSVGLFDEMVPTMYSFFSPCQTVCRSGGGGGDLCSQFSHFPPLCQHSTGGSSSFQGGAEPLDDDDVIVLVLKPYRHVSMRSRRMKCTLLSGCNIKQRWGGAEVKESRMRSLHFQTTHTHTRECREYLMCSSVYCDISSNMFVVCICLVC